MASKANKAKAASGRKTVDVKALAGVLSAARKTGKGAGKGSVPEACRVLPGDWYEWVFESVLSVPAHETLNVALTSDEDGPALWVTCKPRFPFSKRGTVNRNWVEDLPSDAPEAWTTGTGSDRKPTAEARPYLVTVDGTLTGLPMLSGIEVAVSPSGQHKFYSWEELAKPEIRNVLIPASLSMAGQNAKETVLLAWANAHPDRADEVLTAK